jgi:3-deoxy-D-arabino-heptulosonate 7-phosphate (DAHP) synthase
LAGADSQDVGPGIDAPPSGSATEDCPQAITKPPDPFIRAAITDACLDGETTERIIRKAAGK